VHGESGEAATDIEERIAAMRLEMFTAAEELDFEKAARLRDDLKRLQGVAGTSHDSKPPPGPAFDPYAAGKKAKRGTVKAKAAAPSRNGRRYKVR